MKNRYNWYCEGNLEGWNVDSTKGRYIADVTDDMYHLYRYEDYRTEYPIKENICNSKVENEIAKYELDKEEFELDDNKYRVEFYNQDNENFCTIDSITGNTVKCLYNQKWEGFDNLLSNLHKQDLEHIEDYLYDNYCQ